MDTKISLRSKLNGQVVLAVWKLANRLPAGTLNWLSKPIGRVYWLASPSTRRAILENMEICFPDLPREQRTRLGRESLSGTVLGFLESGKWTFGHSQRATCSIEGLENLLEAKAQGKGVLLLGMHFNDMIAAVTLLNRHTPVGAMYLRLSNPILEKAVREGRERNVKMFERSNVFAIASALRKGEVIWFAPDQVYGDKQQVFAPFFGIPVPTLTSLSRFVRTLGVEVVPFLHRRAGNAFEMIFAPRLEGLGTDEVVDATRINRLVEAHIRERPEAYMWVNWRLGHWRNESMRAPGD